MNRAPVDVRDRDVLSATPPPSSKHLVVLYLAEDAWRQIQERIHRHGAGIVRSHNPYWDRHGVTIEDPDGYRIVLHRVPGLHDDHFASSFHSGQATIETPQYATPARCGKGSAEFDEIARCFPAHR